MTRRKTLTTLIAPQRSRSSAERGPGRPPLCASARTPDAQPSPTSTARLPSSRTHHWPRGQTGQDVATARQTVARRVERSRSQAPCPLAGLLLLVPHAGEQEPPWRAGLVGGRR